jgi:ADP-heptose:LPS heptosyltransferase
MRKLRLDSNGIASFRGQGLNIPSAHPYTKASPALGRLDQLLQGHSPKILITRTQGGIGDVLMTLPTVRAIKKKYGDNCIVTYATDPGYLDGALVKVVQGVPYIDEVVDYRGIKPADYDAIVELTCPCVAHEMPLAPPINRIDLFAAHAGVRLDDWSMDYIVTDKERAWAQEFLANYRIDNKKLIVVQPNSSTRRRDLPAAILQRGVAKLVRSVPNSRALIIVHSGTANSEISWRMEGCDEFRDYDVRHIAAIIERSHLVMCQDSAVLHLAAALRKKTLTFFGPTDPRARVNYHPEAAALWFGGDLACSPCWYSPSCSVGYICWKSITDDLIVDLGSKMLNDQPLPAAPYIVSFGEMTPPGDIPSEVL